MSAIVCGKRSFFDDLQASSPTSASPPLSKRIRCSSSGSPVRFSPFQPLLGLIQQLKSLYPDMDDHVLEKALEECGCDLDAAIKRLHDLRVVYDESHEMKPDANARTNDDTQNGLAHANEEVAPSKDPSVQNSLPQNGEEWVELFLREMNSATNIDDARSRATRVLESLEKSISERLSADAAQNILKENLILKEQIVMLLRENGILKRAVAIQHEHQKEHEGRNQEVEQLKRMVSQYQEQLRTLEVKNYALSMHLRQAQQSNSIPGFNPHVF